MLCESLVDARSVAEIDCNEISQSYKFQAFWIVNIPYKGWPGKDDIQENKCTESYRT